MEEPQSKFQIQTSKTKLSLRILNSASYRVAKFQQLRKMRKKHWLTVSGKDLFWKIHQHLFKSQKLGLQFHLLLVRKNKTKNRKIAKQNLKCNFHFQLNSKTNLFTEHHNYLLKLSNHVRINTKSQQKNQNSNQNSP